MRNLNFSDIEEISKNTKLLHEFGIDSGSFLYQIGTVNLNYDLSVVEHDENGEIIGMLVFGNYSILDGSPIINMCWNKAKILSKKKGLNGYMFYIDNAYRGKGLDKKMIEYAYPKIIDKGYDYIWIGVASEFRSHAYWLRKGFKKLFDFSDKATFYIYMFKD